ncbi:MAG: class I SAM-dependent methyltransferase [Chloroflexi bacterium]|nr:class I SAM-dependent methyltransferase [Chloroflexota bacterium]OJW04132.1 MAG: ubiquinone biosynthesis methyltransferase UbiE [Chloroflexi bacterium 54-19]
MTQTVDEVQVLKNRVKATWMAGDYAKIAVIIQSHAEEFVARLALTPGTNVLDAACGTGNLSIPAARTGALITAQDLAPNLVEVARQRAAAEGLNIHFDSGDVEDLPYATGTFQVVMSMYGIMFAPRPAPVAAQLLRVCAPGGLIALANWTPNGFIGQMLKVVSTHVPPAPGMTPPPQWGVEEIVRERLGDGTASTEIKCTPRKVQFLLPFSPAQTVDYFIQYYGPTNRAYAACSPEKQVALRQDLENLWSSHNTARDGTTAVESEYLEVIAKRV